MDNMTDEQFAAELGVTEGEQTDVEQTGVEQEQEQEVSPAWFRDIDEDTGYNILQQAKEFPDRLNAVRDQAFGKMGGLERQLKELSAFAQKVGTQAALDPEPIRKILEKYDPALAAAGLAEAIAEAVKVTPFDETMLSPYLSPLREQLGELPLGAQIVLSHYTKEDLDSIVPPADAQGNLAPSTQRHKDFIRWYELQPHVVQTSLEQFGPQYVHSLRSFEKWERAQQDKKVQSSGNAVQRLAGGQQPSAQRKSGATRVAQSAEEAFVNAWNEAD